MPLFLYVIHYDFLHYRTLAYMILSESGAKPKKKKETNEIKNLSEI